MAKAPVKIVKPPWRTPSPTRQILRDSKSANDRRPKQAIIGASGVIGDQHIRDILASPDAELTAIIDPADTAPALAEKHGAQFFPSLDAFLQASSAGEDASVDAIILATPTATHVPFTMSLLNRGFAVLIEKPVCTNSTEGLKLLQACDADYKADGGVYMVGHHRRHATYAAALKQAIHDGRLGKLVAINGVWAARKADDYFEVPWRQKIGSGGVLLTNAIHEIDLLQYCMGRIVEVFATEGLKDRPYPVESTVQVVLKFESGAVGSFLWSDIATSPHTWEFATGESPRFPQTHQHNLTVFGTKGSISVPSLTLFHYQDQPESERHWNSHFSTDETYQSYVDGTTPYKRQLEHFIAVARREEEPNCSVREGLRAVYVVEALFNSLESNSPVAVAQIPE